MVINPYRLGSCWVFDDANFNLKAEAFVLGMSEIIDKVLKNKSIKDPEKGFSLIFSALPFPQHDLCMKFSRADIVGNWYRAESLDMEGWLCPALFHYFKEAPKEIYAKVESLK